MMQYFKSALKIVNKNYNMMAERFRSVGKDRLYKLLLSIFRAMLLIGIGYILIYPVLYMLSSSFKPVAQNYDPSVIWLPKSFTMDNIKDALNVMKFSQAVKNTLAIGIVSALLQIVSCMLVGYGFARFKFKGRELLFGLVLLTLIIPPQTISVPLYLQFKNFNLFGLLDLFRGASGKTGGINLIDSYWAFYLPSILGMGLRSGLFIYVFRQFFRGMSRELEDAAVIDGCGSFKTFYRVMLPNAAPAILTVFLFSVVWQWNDYYTPAMFLNNKLTIATSLSMFQQNLRLVTTIGGNYQDPYVVSTRIQAACLLATTPILLVYIFTQRYFTESIERTGIKG